VAYFCRAQKAAGLMVKGAEAVPGKKGDLTVGYLNPRRWRGRSQSAAFERAKELRREIDSGQDPNKKLENHEAAVALYAAHFNFCRVHEILRVTPAMQLGVADHIWSVGELVDAALSNDAPKLCERQVGPFWIIDGGRS
jgi:hypothetical protein